MKLLLLDNHDSFTWNLVELLRGFDKIKVNIITPEKFQVEELDLYDQIFFSPGPGLPDEQPVLSGILKALEKRWKDHPETCSLFGVCLGMQAIAQYFGGNLRNLPNVVHGQPRKLKIIRPGHHLFTGIPKNPTVGLYHSWAVDRDTLPECLEVLALSEEGVIMALAHKTYPVCGVQFHPESIMTKNGLQMVSNWLVSGKKQ